MSDDLDYDAITADEPDPGQPGDIEDAPPDEPDDDPPDEAEQA